MQQPKQSQPSSSESNSDKSSECESASKIPHDAPSVDLSRPPPPLPKGVIYPNLNRVNQSKQAWIQPNQSQYSNVNKNNYFQNNYDSNYPPLNRNDHYYRKNNTMRNPNFHHKGFVNNHSGGYKKYNNNQQTGFHKSKIFKFNRMDYRKNN